MSLPEITGPVWLNPHRIVNDALPIGFGPLECSSCVALSVFVQVCWDANGYYRELDVHWKATRKELRQAYQRLDGQDSRRLTYVLKQLLNPEVRRAYDSTPLGEPFLDDLYVQEEIKRRAATEAGRRSRSGVPVTPESVLDQQGLRILDDTLAGGLENDAPEWSYDQALEEDHSWDYSFYILDTTDDSGIGLGAWQRMLVQRLAWAEEVVHFAVGIHARDSRSTIVQYINGVPVFFLRVDLISTEDLADEAVFKMYRYHANKNPPAQVQGVTRGSSEVEQGSR